jgi:hypothetical protein
MKRTIFIGNIMALAFAVVSAVGNHCSPWTTDMLVAARLWSGLAQVPNFESAFAWVRAAASVRIS